MRATSPHVAVIMRNGLPCSAQADLEADRITGDQINFCTIDVSFFLFFSVFPSSHSNTQRLGSRLSQLRPSQCCLEAELFSQGGARDDLCCLLMIEALSFCLKRADL